MVSIPLISGLFDYPLLACKCGGGQRVSIPLISGLFDYGTVEEVVMRNGVSIPLISGLFDYVLLRAISPYHPSFNPFDFRAF